MKMDKKKLIAQIGANIAQSNPDLPPEKKQPEPVPLPPSSSSNTGTGKQSAFWLDDEDRQLFQELGMFLYSQGIKPSNNLLFRAALRMVPRDHQLVEKVRELLAADGRKMRHKKVGGE